MNHFRKGILFHFNSGASYNLLYMQCFAQPTIFLIFIKNGEPVKSMMNSYAL